MLGVSMIMGKELGIYDAITAVSTKEKPATAAEIARKAGLKERCVRCLWISINFENFQTDFEVASYCCW